jgi:hypothetical protein
MFAEHLGDNLEFLCMEKKDRIISDPVLTERSRREVTSFLILDPLKLTKSVPNRSMVVLKSSYSINKVLKS